MRSCGETLKDACIQTDRASYVARPALLGKLQPGDVYKLKIEYGDAGSCACPLAFQLITAHLLHSIAALGCSTLRVSA